MQIAINYNTRSYRDREMIRIVSGAAGYPILKTLRRGEQLRDARAVDVLAGAAPVRTVTEVQPNIPAVRNFESLLTCCLFVKPTLDLFFKGKAPPGISRPHVVCHPVPGSGPPLRGPGHAGLQPHVLARLGKYFYYFQTNIFWPPPTTGKLAGAPVKARTGNLSAG